MGLSEHKKVVPDTGKHTDHSGPLTSVFSAERPEPHISKRPNGNV